MLQLAALRSLAAVPLLILAMRFGLTASPLSWIDSLTLAARVLVVVLAVQPIWVIVAFSKNTNDTSARVWFTALILLGISLGVLTAIIVGAVLFALRSLPGILIAASVVLAVTHGALLFSGWFYNRGMFDLIARSR